MSKKPNILKNYILNSTLTALNIVYPLITYPWVNRILGPEKIGLVNWAVSIVSYFLLIAGLGIPIFGIREIARYQNNKQKRTEVLGELIGTTISASVLCTIALGIIVVFSPTMSNEFSLFCVVGLSIIINAFSVDWYFMGMENYFFITVRSIVVKSLTLVAFFLFVREESDYVTYAFISMIATSGSNLINIVSLVKAKELVGIKFTGFVSVVKKAGILFFVSLAISVYASGNITVLGYLASKREVGYFTTSFKILQLSLAFLSSLVGVLLPRLSNSYQNEQIEEYHRTIALGFSGLLRLIYPIFVGMLFLASEMVGVIGGAEFVPSIAILMLLSPVVIVSGVSNFVTNLIFIATGKERKVLVAALLGGVTCIALDFIFIPSLGGFGAGIAFLCAEVIIMTFYIFNIERHLGIMLIKNLFGKHTLSAILMGGVVFFVRDIFENVVVSLFSAIVIGALSYVVLMTAVFRDALVIDMLQRILKRKKNAEETGRG